MIKPVEDNVVVGVIVDVVAGVSILIMRLCVQTEYGDNCLKLLTSCYSWRQQMMGW